MSLNRSLQLAGITAGVVGVGILIFSVPAAEMINASYPTDAIEQRRPWQPLEIIGAGTLILGFLSYMTGTYFKWREDRRAEREHIARRAKGQRESKLPPQS